MLGYMSVQAAARPDWDRYFMDIAHVVGRRANCSRRQVAAVIVKDRRIISTGYNGTPRGVRNCFEGGCPRCASDAPSGHNLGECICSHAEENAIVQAAYHGIAVRSGVLYCTLSPCLTCAKMIVNAGIAEVVYESEYRFTGQTRDLLAEAGVEFRQLVRPEA
jgi:dCMP deaminase